MKYIFSISITLIIFFACEENKYKSIERDEEPAIYSAQPTDEIMNKAILTAQQTLEKFDTALLSKNPSYDEFSIKCRFDAENGGGEHLWLNQIVIRNGNYFGVVNSNPEFTHAVKFGDSVQIKRETITDWMYLDNGVLKGGYTIRAIRNQMTEKEKQSFDAEIGFKIED